MSRFRHILSLLKSAGYSNVWTTSIALGVMALYVSSRMGWLPPDLVDEVLLMGIVFLAFMAKDGHK